LERGALKIRRKKTRQIKLGAVSIGGDAPIAIQSMTKMPTRNVAGTVEQCRRLAEAGCEIVRIAVQTDTEARALANIKAEVPLPLVADIHFDYRLALRALESGADGVRINPGNIGSDERVAEVARAAAARGAPIRVGVNSGSVEKALLEKHGGPTPRALAESALNCVKKIEDAGHNQIKISVKATDVLDTIGAYEIVSSSTDYPLHVGVTEAGPLLVSAVRSSLGIGYLLLRGIGDTIRVSVTGDPVVEVVVAREMLQSLGLRSFGPTIVSCPTCGRCEIDVVNLVAEVQKRLGEVRKNIKVAIMGCVVNGPGEAREADVGLAGGRAEGVIFRKGEIVRKVREEELIDALMEEIKKF
jgi:(E)-4-hydroxy-3-methylbut-2-enyl-diphosphate synthase